MSTTTTLHNKPVPALRRLWSMFGTESWDRSTSTPKPKSDDDGRGSRSSESLTQQPLLPAGSLKGNVSAVISIVWAFTKNDIFTFSLPCVIFGAALSLAKDARTAPEPPTFNQVLSRLLGSSMFQFISLLLFDVDNQRDPTSVAEDRINKPWRPIPSGMITSDQSRRLVLFLVPLTMALGYALGVWNEALLVVIAAWVYDHLGGGDEPIVREVVLGISYAVFQIASLRIALGSGEYHAQTQTDMVADVISPSGYAWTAITGTLIATTIPIQDMKDQEGDRLRPIRKTLPLFIGDTATRYYLAVTIPVWSVVGTVFWRTPGWYAVPIMVYGGYIAWRLLAKRNRVADEASWRNWSRWLMLVYALPAVNALMQ
ncbi:UbiA prenyltransferase family-domain-containing protein [Neurospora tetraspora]|uniref:UbiA prenyltransferase family-domain-containing protein n=1 Tax=Neurospora tetraspora TaxID=94610 RepID=A0AAE0JE39_9PEZI|nr:UbiA prenyltransferase family-domain-containing protein [Neurospora tetraspora]